MKLYKKEIQPLGLYDTEEFTAERLIPGFEGWYPEEQKEELCKLIFERHSEAFKDELLELNFNERFVEVEFGTCKNCNHGECRRAGVWCHIFEIYMSEENFCSLYWNGED